jgi:hypothetical protein
MAENKGHNEFERAIGIYLNNLAMTDASFKKKFENPSKNLKDCCTFIINEIKKKQGQAFTDETVYGIALHYYDEEVKVGTRANCEIISAPGKNPDALKVNQQRAEQYKNEEIKKKKETKSPEKPIKQDEPKYEQTSLF